MYSSGHIQSLGYTEEAKNYFTNVNMVSIIIIIIMICEGASVGGKNQTKSRV